MQFVSTLQRAFVLEANVTAMNINNFFMNLEKTAKSSKCNKKFIVDDKEITDKTHILECIRKFYETL